MGANVCGVHEVSSKRGRRVMGWRIGGEMVLVPRDARQSVAVLDV
jgi:hypothetical protein